MLGAFSPEGAVEESLSAQFQVRVRGWLESPASRQVRVGNEERLGTAEFQDAGIVRLKTDRSTIEYQDGSNATVNMSYVIDRRSRLRRLLGRPVSWDDLFSLARLGVQEPLLLKLERRGALIVHGSAVSCDGRSIVFVGLNGSGKSTLCARLLSRMDYLSDNFLAWNGQRILGFPSALRMPGSPTDRIPGLPSLHGKSFVAVDSAKIRTSADPSVLIFVSLGPKTSVAPVNSEEACRRLRQIGDMTHEFPEHTYLGPLAPTRDPEQEATLASQVQSFRLTLGDIDEAVRAVTELAR